MENFSTSRFIAWTVWIVASVFYAYQYILRVMPNIMLNDIMRQFGIDEATFGQFSGIYYIGYSLMHLPVGIMLDRYGPKPIMTGCILLSVLGLVPLVFSEHWVYPIVGRLLIGMGSSAAILGVFKIIRMTFNEKKFPRMLSFSVMIGLIGAIYGGAPVNYMCQNLGHKSVVQIFALIGLGLAALTYLIVPKMQGSKNGTVISDVKEVLTNRKVLWVCLMAGLMVGPLEGFADVWASAFLKKVYGFDANLSASLPSIIFIGMCFGAPVLNFIAERIGNYMATIIGSGIVMALIFFLLLASKLSAFAISINFAIIGMCCAYQILAIYKASSYVSEKVAGLTSALANMIIMVFGYAFHSMIGKLVNINGGANESQALVYGITVIPIALILGAVGFIFLPKERKRAFLSK